ncbi:ABC transporter permease [Oceanobacillus polygoni]|uniref:ABC-2 type transport system permease protein n=1 Tax=Oceanobacillus polygoni TaxID=1235259 RepID=A0A9X1CAH4_9BACI|nr:ABC transporter permease [Oceanobacillus polygoni]MBP2076674.1 ABC-2 type transport system permease protein [Oceanobacillus polygoni]
MNKFSTILSHTYITKVKTKSFIFSTLITLLIIAGLANFQSIIDMFAGEDSGEIAVVDESGVYTEALQQSLAAADENIELVPFDGTVDEAKAAIQDGEYGALVVLTESEAQIFDATYFANTITESGNQMIIEQHLQQLKIAIATQASGIDEAMIAEIYAPIAFEAVALDESAKTEEELNQARGIVYVMLFVLYMTVMMYGQMIATDVATEKSSRVMEILISSAPPITHMFAKIIGIALVGLTQIGLFIIVGYTLIRSKQEELVGGVFELFGVQDTSPMIFVYAIVFFILGYLLYATLAAMLGSLVSRIEDVGQLTTPMMMLIVIAFMIAIFGLGAPESTFVTVTSYIPFFTPMIMFLRVGMLDIPIWEIALSLGIMVGTIAILAYIGAKVYSGGVLMYGRSGSLKDFKKALVLGKKEK